jgi:hypothetical protein
MTVTNGLEVHETTLILGAETPSHLLTNESWANAQLGWKIVPEWVKTEVVTARMMDPGDDLDWKVEQAEARARGLSLAARRRCLALWRHHVSREKYRQILRRHHQRMRRSAARQHFGNQSGNTG